MVEGALVDPLAGDGEGGGGGGAGGGGGDRADAGFYCIWNGVSDMPMRESTIVECECRSG